MSENARPVPADDDGAALAAARAGVATHPQRPAAHVALGTALWFAGEREAAVASLRRALDLDPAYADAHNNLGNALVAMGETAAGIAHYEAAIRTRPAHAETHYNLGNAHVTLGAQTEAEAAYRAAIALRPDHAGAHNNLGNVLRGRGEAVEALACYRRALALRPEYFGTANNVGAALLALHRPAEAAVAIEAALALRPDYAEACNNLGGARLALDDPEAALPWFRRAYALDQGQVQARFGEALALLSLGRFAEGWRAYEARWLDPRFREGTAEPPAPRWDGTADLAGRTVLLTGEQGLGDTIQFCRYAPLVAARGAHVVLEVQPSLRTLLAPFAAGVIAAGEAPPECDFACPLLSLPAAFGTTLETVPAAPYLSADPARLADWSRLLGPRTRLRVGVAFSGSPEHSDDALRSIPAAILLPALLATGAELHVVQTEIRQADGAALSALPEVRVHTDALADFAETAALMALMDAIVSVDTSAAHLAGALGRPVLLLLQHAADFRWLRARADSPWYPTARLFRQASAGDWTPPIAAVSDVVSRMTGTSGPRPPSA